MGCAIHLFVERREGPAEPWHPVCVTIPCTRGEHSWCCDDGRRVWRDRNYTLFGMLAHVRDNGLGTIAEPRGLPPDLSPELRKVALEEFNEDFGDFAAREYGCENFGEHSFSYLSLVELDAWDWSLATPNLKWATTRGGAAGEFYSLFLPALRALGGDPNDVRIVFGFDN